MSERNEQMVALREGGETLQEIGDRYGLTRERVRQIVGKIRAHSRCATCSKEMPDYRSLGAIYCSRRCAERVHNAPSNHCGNCGRRCTGKLCKGCKREEWAEKRRVRHDRLELLWAEGLPAAVIAERLGTTANALGVEIDRARKAGRNLPLRRAVKPKSENLTKAQARLQFTAALRDKKIRRPERCEGCGQKTFVEGHHTDYQKPLFVFWLCDPCHQKAHGKRALEVVAA